MDEAEEFQAMPVGAGRGTVMAPLIDDPFDFPALGASGPPKPKYQPQPYIQTEPQGRPFLMLAGFLHDVQ